MLQRAGPAGPDDVRPDDGGELDLYRNAGSLAGDVRNVCGRGAQTFWRRSEREARRQRRHGRNGRRAAACGDDERRSVSWNRRRSGAHQAAREDRLLRRDGHEPGRGTAYPEKRGAQGRGGVGGVGGELRGPDSRAGAARSCARPADGPDERARPARRLRAEQDDARAVARAAEEKSRGIQEARARGDCRARAGNAGAAEARRGDLRLRQQHPHIRLPARREECV